MSKKFVQSWLAMDVQESNRTAMRLRKGCRNFSLSTGSLAGGLLTTVVLEGQEQMVAANVTFGACVTLGAPATGFYLARTFSLDRQLTRQENEINTYVDRVVQRLEVGGEFAAIDDLEIFPSESTTEDSE